MEHTRGNHSDTFGGVGDSERCDCEDVKVSSPMKPEENIYDNRF